MAKKKILPRIFLWLVIAVFCVGLAFCTVTVINGRKMYKDAIKRTSVQQMYDEISSREGYVRIDNVSPVFLDAIIAIEDHRFYEHSGYDLVSIGAYKKGTNHALDEAIRKIDRINGFLCQSTDEAFSFEDTVKMLAEAVK